MTALTNSLPYLTDRPSCQNIGKQHHGKQLYPPYTFWSLLCFCIQCLPSARPQMSSADHPCFSCHVLVPTAPVLILIGLLVEKSGLRTWVAFVWWYWRLVVISRTTPGLWGALSSWCWVPFWAYVCSNHQVICSAFCLASMPHFRKEGHIRLSPWKFPLLILSLLFNRFTDIHIVLQTHYHRELVFQEGSCFRPLLTHSWFRPSSRKFCLSGGRSKIPRELDEHNKKS